MNTLESLDQAKLAAQVADNKLGQNIILLDVRQQTSLADYFLFIGATSHLHVRALEDSLRSALREAGHKLLRIDGQRGHLWRVLDYGSMIIHIMEAKTREFYSVERLWDQGKRISFAPPPKPVKSPKKSAKPKSKPKAKAKTPRKRKK